MIHETIALSAENPNVTLSTYLIGGDRRFGGPRRRPAVLVLPGGGYMVCASPEGEPAALSFARMGYHAFVLNYTVCPEQREALPAGGLWPRPLLDVKAAMEYIASHAKAWGVDAEQIAICGFSAGAHLAGMYGSRWRALDMPRPAALILSYALGDVRGNGVDALTPERRAAAENFCAVLTGSPAPDEKTLDSLSVQKNICADTPPTFLWNTAEDDSVPAEQTLSLAQALYLSRVPFEVHTFAHGPHALGVADESCAGSPERCLPDVAVWTKLAAAWLKGYLHLVF